ncbi:hypothetical protein L810_0809 [Burkholderia sp. AU4i]|nr:hypothetical protein L810_0809 [Burkholderia sp. AU4i]
MAWIESYPAGSHAIARSSRVPLHAQSPHCHETSRNPA